jgi:hypothetical protein
MAKKQTLTVATEVGTFTRTTARTYAFVVVVKGERAEYLESIRVADLAAKRRELARCQHVLATGVDPQARKGSQWDLDCTAKFLAEGRYEKWVAEYTKEIAEIEARGPITEDAHDDKFGAFGWCGRLDLAIKLAETKQAQTFRHVRIYDMDGKRCDGLVARMR